MTAKELLEKLQCLEYGYGADNKSHDTSRNENLLCLPIVISTESGTQEVKSMILRTDDLSPYCRVIELSTRTFIKDDNEIKALEQKDIK